MIRRHPFLTLITVAYLGFVLWLTLSPTPFDNATNAFITKLLHTLHQHDSTRWINYAVLERGANVALFVPVGGLFLLLCGLRRWGLAILCGVLLSVSIEVTQGLFIPTRVADPVDVVTNGAGTVIGVAVMVALTWGIERRHRIIQNQKEQLDAAHNEIHRLNRASVSPARRPPTLPNTTR